MESRQQTHVPVPTYRDTTIAQALSDSLRDLMNSGEISETTKEMVLSSFDMQIFENFSKLPRCKPTKISGDCITYNNVDEVWKFTLKKMVITADGF